MLAAIGDYDAMGQDAFLSEYGFGRAHEYVLVHEGFSYDSKATLALPTSMQPGHSSPPPPSRGARTVQRSVWRNWGSR